MEKESSTEWSFMESNCCGKFGGGANKAPIRNIDGHATSMFAKALVRIFVSVVCLCVCLLLFVVVALLVTAVGTMYRSFFFLWCGRSRSKARSLHENKLLSRKLQHGHRWSHANWQIMTTKHKRPTTKGQDADPPARFASHHHKDSKTNSERGKSRTETTTEDLPRTQW